MDDVTCPRFLQSMIFNNVMRLQKGPDINLIQSAYEKKEKEAI